MSGSARSRAIAGALGGIVATAAMTVAMRKMHALLPANERYPLTPREITDEVGAPKGEDAARDRAVLAHFGFGGAAGALIGAPRLPASTGAGVAWGVLVWLASYLGWVPRAGVLKPATAHPLRRNALMIAAHVVWGAVFTRTAREVMAARDEVFADGPRKDAK